jgi:hypothetical protein
MGTGMGTIKNTHGLPVQNTSDVYVSMIGHINRTKWPLDEQK